MTCRDLYHLSSCCCVEQTECGTLRPGRVFGASNGHYRNSTIQQSIELRLLLYGHREIVPTRHAQIGPMVDPARRIGLDETPDCGGGAAGPCGAADLIADHANLLPLAHQLEHGEHKISPCRGIYPGRAQNDAAARSF